MQTPETNHDFSQNRKKNASRFLPLRRVSEEAECFVFRRLFDLVLQKLYLQALSVCVCVCVFKSIYEERERERERERLKFRELNLLFEVKG